MAAFEKATCGGCGEAIRRKVGRGKNRGPWWHDGMLLLARRRTDYDHHADPDSDKVTSVHKVERAVKAPAFVFREKPEGLDSAGGRAFWAGEMRRHVEYLAKFHGIEISTLPYAGGHAYPELGFVRIPEVRGFTTYFTALHELGHHLAESHQSMTRLDQEAAAWDWALDNAAFKPSPTVKKHIGKCLRSYAKRAENWRSMVQGGDRFKRLLDEMEGSG